MWLLPLVFGSSAQAYWYWYNYDWDGDGYYSWYDCNDYDYWTHPGAYEWIGDGVDQNCDGLENCFQDGDWDGYGSGVVVTSSDFYCGSGGVSWNSWDCNDGWGFVYPGAYEYVADGVDENCDSQELCWQDSDGDGWGVGNVVVSGNLSCGDAGEAWGTGDCNDAVWWVHPGAGEGIADGIDQDCDGRELCWYDADGDHAGSGSTTGSSDLDCLDPGEATSPNDCNDANGSIHPGAVEGVGDGVDQNCDGAETCWADADNDGARTTGTVASADSDCLDAFEGVTSDPIDCNDGNSAVRPGVAEIAGDNVDQNCDGVEVCYTDVDNDGARTSTTFNSADADCNDPSEGLAGDPLDCNDANAAILPGAVEQKGDEIDQNCDGAELCWPDADNDGDRAATGQVNSADTDCADANEGRSSDPVDCDDNNAGRASTNAEITGNQQDDNCDGSEICYVDNDGDNTRSTATIVSGDADCIDGTEEPASSPLDCNDADATVSPLLSEVTGNGVDNNCDGGETCYLDNDDDDYRVTATLASADADCADPREALSSAGIDCDDNNAAINPSRPEIPANGIDENCDGSDGVIDNDGDGYNTTTDCNDANAGINPGAVEIAGDNVDQNCDGRELCYVDADDDGARTGVTALSPDATCNAATEGLATDPLDCNDANAAIRPGVAEIAGDSVDQNCDGVETCYTDADNDGARLATTVASADADCLDPNEGVTADPLDCNDANAAIKPGATEIAADGIDQNCDAQEACYRDADGDTYGVTTTVVSADLDCLDPGESTRSDDCNDAAAGVFPGAVEIVADNVDQSCDGHELCYVDGDDDNYGTSTTFSSADADCLDANEAPVPGDCNDANAAIKPGATEVVADGVDQNCDSAELCRADGDGDGFGSTATVVSADLDCLDPGESTTTTDCDDTAASVRPGAPEIPGDGIDQSCDGTELCYADLDDDDHGRSTTQVSADLDCIDPNEAPVGDDCNDGNAAVHPGATEIVGNGIDDDCDGASRCWRDNDLDGVGSNVPMTSTPDADCADAGEAAVNGDCDDNDAGNRPGGTEIPADGADQDCDGLDLCFVDADGDGEAASGVTVAAADCAVAPNTAIPGNDCDDADPNVRTGEVEVVGDGIDNNCDGSELCWRDLDGDTWGGPTTVVSADLDCTDPGEQARGGDCDGADASVHPGAIEFALDQVDSDCDGSEQCLDDPDQDGWAAVGAPLVPGDVLCSDPGVTLLDGDCDEGDPAIHPLAPETPGDGIDQDCSGSDLVGCYVDLDGDGFGDVIGSDPNGDGVCDDPNRSGLGGDCDDADADAFPGAPEIPADGVDQDCDGEDAARCFEDQDRDGFGSSVEVASADPTCAAADLALVSGDCDDQAPDVFPGAPEVLGDGFDQDCDGLDLVECWVDLDGDGYGGPTTEFDTDGICTDPGQAEQGGDCDDADAAIHPAALEVLSDGIDQDCDGADLQGCWEDLDLDGFGSTVFVPDADGVCDAPGQTDVGGDCDDDDPTTYPGAFELEADGVDQDCDGFETCYADPDGDRWADPSAALVTADLICSDPGVTAALGDCLEGDPTVHPGATEITNDGIDQDCQGGDLVGCWIDADYDGFGSDTLVVDADGICEAGKSTIGGDCADGDPTVHPGAVEIVGDGFDQDCDGFETCYQDLDFDGVGAGTVQALSCNGLRTSAIGGDCDDTNDQVLPGAPEICGNGVDDDCDGTGGPDTDDDGDGLTWAEEEAIGLDDCIADFDHDGLDDGVEVGPDPTHPRDSDGDGIIDAMEPLEPIETGHTGVPEPTGTTGATGETGGPSHTDTEPPPGVDEDGDGVPASEDCDDHDPDAFPGAPEDVGGRDLDCDGMSDPTDPVKLACGCDTPADPARGLGLLTSVSLLLAALRRRWS